MEKIREIEQWKNINIYLKLSFAHMKSNSVAACLANFNEQTNGEFKEVTTS